MQKTGRYEHMGKKRLLKFILLTAALTVTVMGCQTAPEPADDGAHDAEIISESPDTADAEQNYEAEGENMQDEQKDMIAEAIRQETASVELETDDSQDGVLTEGEPTAEISEMIPAKYLSLRVTECGTIENISYTTYDYFGDGSEIEKQANVYLPYG